MDEGYQFCEVEAQDRVLTVRINRPDRRNALNRAASFELHEVFNQFEQNPEYRVAIITGAGDRAFCAGADLRSEERTAIEDAVPESGFGGLVARGGRAKPVIAAVNGFALGGGFEIALACDLVVAADDASFGLPEPRVGLIPGSGGVQRILREIGPKRANSIILTGRRVAARGPGTRIRERGGASIRTARHCPQVRERDARLLARRASCRQGHC